MVTLVLTVSTPDCDSVRMGSNPIRYPKYTQVTQLVAASQIGNTHGTGNKGKPKSDEQKRKIAESIKAKHQAGGYYKNKPGRKKKGEGGGTVYTPDLKSGGE